VGVAAGASRVLLCGAAAAASAILIGKLYVELSILSPRAAATERWHDTVQLLVGPLRPVVQARLGLALLAVTATWATVAVGAVASGAAMSAAIAALTLAALGEAAERYLFFRSMTSPRMPGARH
jgi:hypothetical protein